jgi:3'-phosphoadenosine 5'-phosphosulfate sulfotransferase (PAPS reductase)/FAD synthetase
MNYKLLALEALADIVPGEPIVMTYGGGTNSTAMLVGLRDRGIRPDLILFADTGGEKPHTYRHLETVNTWLARQSWEPITVVRYATREGEELTLEQDCLNRRALPGIAYGFKSCSERWKARPQDKFLKTWEPAVQAWAKGLKVVKFVGFDAGEPKRIKNHDSPRFKVRYPLAAWDWAREECVEAIRREGLPLPGKSACFFCPSSTKPEIRDLAQQYPDLYGRAVGMERNAELSAVKGLGRRFAWGELPLDLPAEPETVQELPCECFDGTTEPDSTPL